jgi:hypothetical protein
VTTWRSGSTFLAELLSSYPATFYHYEPFTGHGIHRLRDDNETELAADMIKTLLNCSYKPHIGKIYILGENCCDEVAAKLKLLRKSGDRQLIVWQT